MNAINWSELQPELIQLIARKLTLNLDYIRFRAVCVKWCSSVPPIPHHLPTQLPWLMLQSEPQEDNRRFFYDLSENKLYQLNISNSHRHCCGSSLGWLLLTEDRSPSLLLFNPLTRIEIHLPPLTAFPDVLDFNINNVDKEYLLQVQKGGSQYHLSLDLMRDLFINKFVLSSNPTSLNEDFIVVAIIGLDGELAFCKKGDEEWTMIEDARSRYIDVIYFKGLFYAVKEEDSITVCDVSGFSPMVTFIEPPPPPPPIVYRNYSKPYLVDSYEELLLVNRLFYRFNDDNHVFRTVGFEVFKLDSSRPEWVKVTNLGDRMLFLGMNSSLCLLATNFSGLKGNCIYFTGECTRYFTSQNIHDSGVFNLGDNSFKALPYSTGQGLLSILPPSVWVTPSP